MVITRKIQIFVSEQDADKKKQYIHTIYDWRSKCVQAANAIVAHKFVQQNVRDFVYITDEMKDKFLVSDILKKEPGNSEQNTTYRIASKIFKGSAPVSIASSLNQAVAKTYKEESFDVARGEKSLRSYRNTLPIPFGGKDVRHLNYNADDKRYYFDLFGITFGTALGADRSNNAIILDRIIAGEYKLCSSSLQIDDRKKKFFLLLCVDIPKQEHKFKKDKVLYAVLGVQNPIVCYVGVEFTDKLRPYSIGTAEEYNYRRRQIQEAVRRCQINNRYSSGGHGRNKKCKAIDRFHDKEKNYITTRVHTYSRMLIDYAIKQGCGKIVLMQQLRREEEAKEDEYVLRNWSYYGLKDKIAYKCKLNNIELKVK